MVTETLDTHSELKVNTGFYRNVSALRAYTVVSAITGCVFILCAVLLSESLFTSSSQNLPLLFGH